MTAQSAYRIWLPFPPSQNNLFAHGTVKGRTRRFPTRTYNRWRKDAGILIRASRPPRFTGHVSVRIQLTPPSSRRRDVDNHQKALLDALVDGRVLEDDSLVQDIAAKWDHAFTEPGAWVEIIPLDTAPAVEARPLAKQSLSDADVLNLIKATGPVVLDANGSMVLGKAMRKFAPSITRLRDKGLLVPAADGLFGSSQTLVPAGG